MRGTVLAYCCAANYLSLRYRNLRTALGCALHSRNTAALKMLGKRVDLVVREEDLELAKDMGININDYIDPRPIGTIEVTKEQTELANIFREYFMSRK